MAFSSWSLTFRVPQVFATETPLAGGGEDVLMVVLNGGFGYLAYFKRIF